MKEIKLTREKVTLVDDEDWDKLNQFSWHAIPSRNTYYASHCKYIERINGKSVKEYIQMHRFILGIKDPKIKVDHRNGDGLDNRKENLRLSTNVQNSRNRTQIHPTNTSGYRGIYFEKNVQKWRVCICLPVNGKNSVKKIGYFSTAEEAAKAFDKAAKEIYGEFCGQLNFEEKV